MVKDLRVSVHDFTLYCWNKMAQGLDLRRLTVRTYQASGGLFFGNREGISMRFLFSFISLFRFSL